MSDSEHQALRLLSIEDDPVAAELLAAQLDSSPLDCTVERAATMAQALEMLATSAFDLILLDLMLPDSHGLDGLELLRLEADVPVVVITSQADEQVALEALSKGAQDYLFKGEISTHIVIRSIRYAVERHRLTNTLRELTLIDDLTGLYNRRGFSALARQQLKIAERLKRGVAVFLADVNSFKEINDRFGHLEGDRALQTVARILEDTFRAADVVARWGGDEFVMLGLADGPEKLAAIANRIDERIEKTAELGYPLSLSLGAHFEPEPRVAQLDQMVASADRALYDEKTRRAGSPS